MPTYTYACKDCGDRMEVVRSFTDDPLTTCPACDGRLRQVFKPAGIVFKGSGWHSKDYAKSSGNGATAGRGDEATESSDSSGGASDSSDSSTDSPSTTSTTSGTSSDSSSSSSSSSSGD